MGRDFRGSWDRGVHFAEVDINPQKPDINYGRLENGPKHHVPTLEPVNIFLFFLMWKKVCD